MRSLAIWEVSPWSSEFFGAEEFEYRVLRDISYFPGSSGTKGGPRLSGRPSLLLTYAHVLCWVRV